MFRIVTAPIDVTALQALVSRPEAGAISLFLGVTRNHQQGKAVLRLEYEAYAPMACKVMEQIAAEAKAKWRLEAVALHHRIGVVPVGEASVGIAVSAAHRAEAIEACHYLIDRLKEVVPVWKKEFFSDGQAQWLANFPRQ